MKQLSVILALILLGSGCGPRHNKDKKRGVYAAPRNAQEAAWRWPGDKIEARSSEGVVQMRLRVRGTRIRAYGDKMALVGDVRRDGDAYVLRDPSGEPIYRVEPPDPNLVDAPWTLCRISASGCDGAPERLWGGATVRIDQGEDTVSLARAEGNGALVERAGGGFRIERTGSDRFEVSAAGGDAGTIVGAASPFVAAPMVSEELAPLVRAGFAVVIEDHHGSWSLSP